MASAVHFRDVVSLAGRFPLLAGASLDVDEGEVVHLRGPNGAGKTSLLRALAGLLPVASGEAFVLGHDLRADQRAVRRDVGMIGHATFLYDDLTVLDNVQFALRAAGVPLERAAGSIDRLGLSGRVAATTVGKLSAGQRRRCALAVLLARSPRLWLLDEPHAGLDPEGQQLVDELVDEARAAGVTLVVASHDLDRMEPLADRVLEVVGGRVTEDAALGVDGGATEAERSGTNRSGAIRISLEGEGGRDVA